MNKALYTAGTGMKAQQIAVDVAANNLANVNTPGFKRSTVSFKDLLYMNLTVPGAATTSSANSPAGAQIGTGVEVDSIPKIFSQGVIEPTGRDLDLAIRGSGFFQVQLPSGETGYTRSGAFQVDVNGNLTTGDGFIVQPAVVIPANAVEVTVGLDGTVSAVAADGTSSNIGQIQLARFLNPAGLTAEGGNVYKSTVSSGTATQGTPGLDGMGTIAQKFLERSNVEVVNEMVSLIVSQRSYEFSSRAIRSADDMLQTINNIVR